MGPKDGGRGRGYSNEAAHGHNRAEKNTTNCCHNKRTGGFLKPDHVRTERRLGTPLLKVLHTSLAHGTKAALHKVRSR